jgi:hypothetical protein
VSDSLLQKAEEARKQKDFSFAETIYRIESWARGAS